MPVVLKYGGCEVGMWLCMETFLVVTTRGGGRFWHLVGGTVKSPKCTGQPPQLRFIWPPMSNVNVEKCWYMVIEKRKIV